MLLTHQSGIQHVREWLPEGAFADWDYMIGVIERETPFFEPGTDYGYQALTHGWLIGELVRRVTGESLGTFINEKIVEPLGAEFWLGLPEELDPKVAKMIVAPPPDFGQPVADFWQKVFLEPASPQAGIFLNAGGFMSDFDSPLYRRAEIGSANGYTNARGLAKIYAVLATGGALGDVELVDKHVLAGMGAVRSAGLDKTLLIRTRFGLGYMKSTDNRWDIQNSAHHVENMLLSESAFGHPGFGGSVGFADPQARISFGYTMNKMGGGTMLTERGQSLINATYRSIGYSSNESGIWVK